MEELHFEVPPNAQALLYDDAVNELKGFCKDLELDAIQSIKFHTNTWGLSSCNYFGDEILSRMKSLQRIDFSDTIKYRHRSDLCAGTKAMLYQVKDYNITYLDLSENFLDTDGARAFNEFLENNSSGSLKVLKLNGCKLANKSIEMMIESQQKNKNLDI